MGGYIELSKEQKELLLLMKERNVDKDSAFAIMLWLKDNGGHSEILKWFKSNKNAGQTELFEKVFDNK